MFQKVECKTITNNTGKGERCVTLKTREFQDKCAVALYVVGEFMCTVSSNFNFTQV
jgi:hypothetical protein